jgi:hypothetical protein
MKLNDSVIAHVGKLVQIAILSGTDIVDHMRMIVLTETDGELFLENDYLEESENHVESMMRELERNSEGA